MEDEFVTSDEMQRDYKMMIDEMEEEELGMKDLLQGEAEEGEEEEEVEEEEEEEEELQPQQGVGGNRRSRPIMQQLLREQHEEIYEQVQEELQELQEELLLVVQLVLRLLMFPIDIVLHHLSCQMFLIVALIQQLVIYLLC